MQVEGMISTTCSHARQAESKFMQALLPSKCIVASAAVVEVHQSHCV